MAAPFPQMRIPHVDSNVMATIPMVEFSPAGSKGFVSVDITAEVVAVLEIPAIFTAALVPQPHRHC